MLRHYVIRITNGVGEGEYLDQLFLVIFLVILCLLLSMFIRFILLQFRSCLQICSFVANGNESS